MNPLALRLPNRERGNVNDLDDLEGFDDIDDSSFQPRTQSGSGRGTIKRLGGGAIKSERWDEDDFASSSAEPNPPAAFTFARPINLAGKDDTDTNLDAEFDDDDDRESTLKPGNKVTVKAVMNQGTIRNSPASSRPAVVKAPVEDDDLDASFELPVDLSSLNLATRAAEVRAARRQAQKRQPQSSLRHRSSLSSIVSSSHTASSDWDSPSRAHETSKPPADRSSIGGASSSASSSSYPVTDRDGFCGAASSSPIGRGKPSVDVVTSADEDEDIADGLVLPSATFFSSGRIQELNKLLDMKRKPEQPPVNRPRPPSGTTPAAAATAPHYARATGASTARSAAATRYDPRDDDIEDGLILAFGGQELTSTRLRRLRNGRALRQQQQQQQQSQPEVSGKTDWSSIGSPGAVQSRQRVTSSDASRVAGGTISGQRWPPPSPSKHESEPRSTLMPPPGTPSRLRHQASHSQLGAGGQTGGGGLFPPRSPGRLSKKSSMQDLNAATGGSLGRHDPRIGLGLREPSLMGEGGYGTVSGSASAGSVAGSRLLRPTASSQAKARPPLHAFDGGSRSSSPSPDTGRPRSISPITSMGVMSMRLLRRPKGTSPGQYGDGSELDAIEDLVDDSNVGVRPRTPGIGSTPRIRTQASRSDLSSYMPPPTPALVNRREPSVGEKRKKAIPVAPTATPSRKTPIAAKPRKQAMLIRHLGKVEKKTVGDMTWNPTTLRWEGNYDVLRDFDAQPPATRPALISHYNFSSGGAALASPVLAAGRSKTSSAITAGVGTSVASLSTTGKTLAAAAATAAKSISSNPPSSGVGGSGSGSGSNAHVIGNMLFDPVKMCWVSTLAAEDDEPDPFADMSDDDNDDVGGGARKGGGIEDDEDDDRRGGTITLRSGGGKGGGQAALLAARLVASGGAGGGFRRFISTSAQSATTTASSRGGAGGANFQHRTQHHPANNDGDDADNDFSGDFFDADFGNPTDAQHPSGHLLRRRRSRTMSLRSGLSDVYLDDALVQETMAAERRHREETRGWWFPYAPPRDANKTIKLQQQRPSNEIRDSSDRDREKVEAERRRKEEKRLWEIRNLAMRS